MTDTVFLLMCDKLCDLTNANNETVFKGQIRAELFTLPLRFGLYATKQIRGTVLLAMEKSRLSEHVEHEFRVKI